MNKTRRKFLKAVGVSGALSFFPFAHLLATTTSDEEGFVLDPLAGETYLIAGRQAPVTIMVDKRKRGVGAVSLCREDIFPQDFIPVHKHGHEDEVIFILRGSGQFTLGDKAYEVKEGSAAFVPKGVWHGLKNTGKETLQMLFSFSPAGFENYFREIGVPEGVAWKGMTAEEFAAIDRKYGIVYKR